MSDVFISYASEDRERIIPLVQLLEAQGWSVWWDRTIFPGKTFDEAIQEAIDEARCVMVVWSNASVRSRWVKTEAAEGDRRGILVPAQLDPCQLPLEFRRVQAAQLMGWRGGEDNVELQRLLGAISEILGGRTPPPEHLGEQALSDQPVSSGTPSLPKAVDGVRSGDVFLGVGIGVLLVVAAVTLVQGWIAERDIWLLVPTFWGPMLGAIVLWVVLRRRMRARRAPGKM